MKNEPVRLGWLSILMVVVILCLAIFAVLSLSTARADLRLATMQAEQVQARYIQEMSGEQWVADITKLLDGKAISDGVTLLEDTTLLDGALSTTLADEEGRTLTITLDVTVSAPYPILEWKHSATWGSEGNMSGLWGT